LLIPLLKWFENHPTTCDTTPLIAINSKASPYNNYVNIRKNYGNSKFYYCLNCNKLPNRFGNKGIVFDTKETDFELASEISWLVPVIFHLMVAVV